MSKRDQTATEGRLDFIGVAAEPLADVRALDRAAVGVETGLEGDHHDASGGNRRVVTLIQAEHLPEIAARCGRVNTDPRLTRRNLVVSGIDLASLLERRFRIGDVLFEGTVPTPPCRRMDENLGEGGMAAMEDRGGIGAIVVEGGEIALGDAVRVEPEA
jgi:MOSC domain-containing protein YiiM